MLGRRQGLGVDEIGWQGRIAELLGVSTRDRMLLKRKAEREGAEPISGNPWEDGGSGI